MLLATGVVSITRQTHPEYQYEATTKLVFGEATWSAPALDSAAQPLAGQPEGFSDEITLPISASPIHTRSCSLNP